MANREIYRIQIISCASNKYWYNELIGALFYVVVENYRPGGEVKFRVVNNDNYPLNTINYEDTKVIEKITRVLLPQENYG